jgi:hypothetical protein
MPRNKKYIAPEESECDLDLGSLDPEDVDRTAAAAAALAGEAAGREPQEAQEHEVDHEQRLDKNFNQLLGAESDGFNPDEVPEGVS